MLEALVNTLDQLGASVKMNADFLLLMLAILWGVQFLNALMHYHLNVLGIYPRTWHGVIGIVTSPFLHGSAQHLFFNTIPLLILSALILTNGQLLFYEVTVFIALLSGSAVWLLGRPAMHVGSSSVIMGYWGFLLANAYQQPSVMSVILGILCLYYCGSLVFSLVPTEERVSYEGHIFGFLSGVLASYLMTHGSRLIFW